MPLAFATIADAAEILALQQAAAVSDPATYGVPWDAVRLAIYRQPGIREKLVLYRDGSAVLRGFFSGYKHQFEDAAVITYIAIDPLLNTGLTLRTMMDLYKTWAQSHDGVSQLIGWVLDGGKFWAYAQARSYTVLSTFDLDDGTYHLLSRDVASVGTG